MASAITHYQEAERLLESAKDDWRSADSGAARTLTLDRVMVALKAAELHVGLAQVGATILAASAPRDALSYEHLFDVVKEL